ncbi:TonB-dependent receptor [Asticcacaulis machinosus]|uniref:TonB-dependent receptor n=1 Tax=Asticcacaulis machinosus TaxID=2984211 RepID=A0ABT5HMJ3_9CAUL|nr:TonB-dependent receptor [Asticcacaulis machinosus]MDC7677397.1 TonB-dependent receptor [Asticcacaulis machinosus]
MMHSNKNARRWVLAASGLIAAVISAPAIAQEVTATTDTAAEAEELETVVVKGLRKSLQSAVNRKRRSAQIVDSIDAEDVGKLPDNNVIEALSRVTGVQVSRQRGEGSGIAIRGMTDVQTTVNGQNNSVGASRSANLSDIPAELLKSVQVYKTRTADQVEGGIAGTVNVDLRRPLDLDRGWTVAGSFRNVNSNIGDHNSPYTSLLVANRWDTDAGQLGFLVNASYTRSNYEENYIDTWDPGLFFAEAYNKLPADMKNIVTPYATLYGYEKGRYSRPSVNAALQWRVNDNLDFVLEGSYFGSEEERNYNNLKVIAREWNNDVSDVVLTSDGRMVESLTVSTPGGRLTGGPQSDYIEADTDNYRANFETHWRGERLNINAALSYNESEYNDYAVLTVMRLDGVDTAHIDFNSSAVSGRGPLITFPGVDLTDASIYRITNFTDRQENLKSNELVAETDISYRISDDKLLRRVQVGARYSDRDTRRNYGYRDAWANTGGWTFDQFPAGSVVSHTPDVKGFDGPTWLSLSSSEIMANMDDVRAFFQDPANNAGIGGGGVSWTSERPGGEVGGVWESKEETTAIFGQLFYAFNLGSIPVDGVAGVRVTKTSGYIKSQQINFDKDWNRVVKDAYGENDYIDTLPSLNAIMHFTPKLQLRLAYTYNVQRPDFMATSSWRTVELNNAVIWAGNPDLKPYRQTSYDASLEYYFGRAGQLSLGAFLKKPKGFMFYDYSWVEDPELVRPENPTGRGRLYMNRNASDGEFSGLEFTAQGFFDFLPGKWSNFGGSLNATYMNKFEITYPVTADGATVEPTAVGTSKYTYNATLYYDTPQFSARVAYNYRDGWRESVYSAFPEYSIYADPTSRLDAAVNYTPVKWLTLSLEGANLLENDYRSYWGENKILAKNIRMMAKTIQLSARFRF